MYTCSSDKNKKFYTVGTVLKYNRKIIKKEEAKSIPLTHKYTTIQLHGSVQALQ